MIASLPSMSSPFPTASSSYQRPSIQSSKSSSDMTRPVIGGSYRPSWPPLLPSMNGRHQDSSAYYHQSRQSSSPTPSNHSGSSPGGEDGGANGHSHSNSQNGLNTQDSKSGALTAAGTGRKRKRLQRACVPCHKAKRRCDGGLPCSNCDFSGRSCSYSDSQGNAVQPTARARPSASASISSGSTSQPEHYGSSYPNGELQASYYTHSAVQPEYAVHHDRFQRPKLAPSYPTPSPTVSSSMPSVGVNAIPAHDQAYEQMRVFQDCAPFNSILPELFYTHQARPSHILSLAIGSFVSSRTDSAFASNEEYTSSVVKLLVEGDHHSGTAQYEHSSTERALALVLLALHDLSKGRNMGALTLSTAALRMVQDLGLHEGAVIPGDVFHPIHCARLVCLVYTVEVIVTAIACKPSCLGELDFAIATSTVSHLATKGEHRGDRVTTAFVALLGSAQVFLDVVQHQRRLALHLPASDTDKSKYRCQEALNSWASNLPAALTFNDANLSDASRSSNGGHGRDTAWGWAWSMMHCFAEMSVCMLENGSSNGQYHGHHQRHHSNGSVGRRSAACNNLVVLLETFRIDTRRSVFALLPLLFAAQGGSEASSSRVSSYLSAVRDNVALNDDQLRRTMIYLGTNGTAGGVSSPTSLMPKIPSPRMRSSSFISRSGPAPPFSPLPLPTPPASDGIPSTKGHASPTRRSPLPSLKIASPPSLRHGLKLPSLSPTSAGEQPRILPSITTSSPSSTSASMKPSYSGGKRSDERTLPPITGLPSSGSKSSISNTLSPIPSFARGL